MSNKQRGFDVENIDDYATELMEDLPHSVIVIDESLTVLYHNRHAALELLNNETAYFIGHFINLIITSQSLIENLNDFIGSDKKRLDTTVSDGEKFYRLRAKGMGHGEAGVTLVLLEDITEQTMAAQKLSEQERMFRQTFELASVGITHLSVDGVWLEVNEKFCEIVGYTRAELVGIKLGEITHPDDRGHDKDIIDSVMRGETLAYTLEKRYVHKDGHLVYVHITGSAVWNEETGDIDYIIVIVKDVSELRSISHQLEAVEEQMVEQEKLASIGQLAAGVAHEINNPVGFVNSNLNSLKHYFDHMKAYFSASEDLVAALEKEDPAIDIKSHLESIDQLAEEDDMAFLLDDTITLIDDCRDGMKRVQDIVQGLKVFARQDAGEFEYADLHENIETTIKVVWNEIKYHCELVKNYGDLPQVECIPNKLNQVIMNLLINAAHAIKEQGTITITTQRGSNHVYLTIEDTGSGIASEHLNQLFNPFFTTKPVGKGTGLGLSIAYGIIQDHHGKISVESEVGKGTKFEIILPINQPQTSPEALEKAPPSH